MKSWRSAIAASSALLIDTQVLIWMAVDQYRLSRRFRERLGDIRTEVQVSAVTAFEFADLQRRRRLPISDPLNEIRARFDLEIVDFPAAAWTIATRLPAIHGDPVDRMLIAHAIVADSTLVTADKLIRRYPVATFW